MHALGLVAPLADDAVPAWQGMQPSLPSADHVPAGHVEQLEPPAAKVPAAQVVQPVAPLEETLPARHDVHARSEVAPAVGEAVPAGQAVQVVAPAAA
jgi:hypothetical protein